MHHRHSLSVILHSSDMKSKLKLAQKNFNLKFLLLGFFLLFVVFFTIVRSNTSPSPTPDPITTKTKTKTTEGEGEGGESSGATQRRQAAPSCTKIPASLADALIHYATSNSTPQQTLKEISVTARVLERKSPCNFLVFGLGHDSLMWAALNHGGRTVFLEEDEAWIGAVRERFPALEAYHVRYDTKLTDADELMEAGRRPECTVVGDLRFSECRLALRGLPAAFYEEEAAWDAIMVDAPTGWVPEAPGRMGAIYTAGMAARGRREGETDVFVHDVDRIVEDKFSKEFLCEGYMKQQEGRLRHFTIPSHRTSLAIPFCPQRDH